MKKLSFVEWAAVVLAIAAFVFFLDRSVLSKETVNLRPQEPKPPFPYHQEDITFENPEVAQDPGRCIKNCYELHPSRDLAE
jgi:hypothetical protein